MPHRIPFGDTAAAPNNKLDKLLHATFMGSRYCIIRRSQIAIVTWATTLLSTRLVQQIIVQRYAALDDSGALILLNMT